MRDDIGGMVRNGNMATTARRAKGGITDQVYGLGYIHDSCRRTE